METLKPYQILRVVIVEDETHLLEALRDHFDSNYEVKAFSSVESALAWIAAGNPFDMILSDLNLPNKTGRDLYNSLKKRGHGEEAKIVFMTAGIFTAELAEWFASIPNIKLEKPFNVGRLRDLLVQMGNSTPSPSIGS